jgi:hypothetical protein
VAGFEPAAGLPYLADMARLERARVRAYHAADAAPIEHALLVGRLARPERLAAARLQLHPSLTPMRSRQGVVSLWCAHQSDRDDAIAAVDVGRPEAALVLRQDDDVLVVPAPAAVARFVEALAEGAALGEAAACGNAVAAAAGEPAFDLAAALALLLRHGALVAWLDPGDLA